MDEPVDEPVDEQSLIQEAQSSNLYKQLNIFSNLLIHNNLICLHRKKNFI
jgi:hypothetical protein